MTALDQEQDVVDLAKRLGLNGTPVEAIINFCQSQIDGWVSEVAGAACRHVVWTNLSWRRFNQNR